MHLSMQSFGLMYYFLLCDFSHMHALAVWNTICTCCCFFSLQFFCLSHLIGIQAKGALEETWSSHFMRLLVILPFILKTFGAFLMSLKNEALPYSYLSFLGCVLA